MAHNARGVTLTELMVAVAILSVGILGFFGAFRFITKSLHISRTRTLATNLAQERVEALKNLTYYELLITTSSGIDTSFSPGLVYDNTNYPPETVSIGGVAFTRYTFVALAQIDGDVISTVTYTFPDTGMKQVKVHIIWSDEGVKKKWTLNNLLENPNVNPLDSSFSGTITKTGGAALPGAVVMVEQNPDWNSSSDSSGNYAFRVYHGSYTIRASSAGYYDGVSPVTGTTAGSNSTANITLTSIGSGTVTGIAWINSSVVVSQVVAETNTVCGDGLSHDVEYIELFNPTPNAIAIGQTGSYPKSVSVNYYDENPAFNRDDMLGGFDFVHVTTYVPAGKYYLLANCTSFVAAGSWIEADAYYGTLFDNIVRKDKAGGIQLANSAGTPIDTVGWEDNNNAAPVYEGNYLPLGQGGQDGIDEGNQVVRVSSPGASQAANSTYGKAYDSDNNENDFLYPYSGFSGIAYPPRNTSSAAQTVITGKPAIGAFISASDPFSGSTQTYSATVASATLSLSYARFDLVGVTTGTWSLVIASGSYYAQIDSVTITQGASTGAPNGATSPSWTLADYSSVKLASSALGGFLEGRVTNLSAVPLSGIQVLAGGTNKTTGVNGAYFAAVASGPVMVIANPNNANPSYIQQITMPTVNTGQITTQNFILSLGGSLQGYLTTGTTPLPNYIVTANIGGSQYGSGASNTTGIFTIRNLSTATYTVAPVLEAGQDSSPNSITATVSSTGTVFVGTFTVTGAFGSIAGTVTNSGSPVTSGALILASTATIPSTPASIAASSSPALIPLYAVSSKADGTYVLPVRGGSTYNLSVYVPTIQTDGTVSVTTKTYSSIVVSPSQTTTRDVAIP